MRQNVSFHWNIRSIFLEIKSLLKKLKEIFENSMPNFAIFQIFRVYLFSRFFYIETFHSYLISQIFQKKSRNLIRAKINTFKVDCLEILFQNLGKFLGFLSGTCILQIRFKNTNLAIMTDREGRFTSNYLKTSVFIKYSNFWKSSINEIDL